MTETQHFFNKARRPPDSFMLLLLNFASVAVDPTVTLANGVVMPRVACGTGGDSSSAAKSAVQVALQAGCSHIDTAHDYACLPGVGEGIAAWLAGGAHVREDLFITSKVPGCGVPTQGLQPPCFSNTYTMASSDITTLVGAKGQVDLMLLHFPPLEGCAVAASCAKIQQQWGALEQLYVEKKARAIGVSNYCIACLECIAKNSTITPMVNQLQYHVGMGPDPDGTLSYCAAHNVTIEAYSPLAGGRLLKDPTFSALASTMLKKYNWTSSAQVALAYVAQRGLGIVTKSDNPQYLAEDLDLFAPQHIIDAADRAKLDAVTSVTCSLEAPGGCCH